MIAQTEQEPVPQKHPPPQDATTALFPCSLLTAARGCHARKKLIADPHGRPIKAPGHRLGIWAGVVHHLQLAGLQGLQALLRRVTPQQALIHGVPIGSLPGAAWDLVTAEKYTKNSDTIPRTLDYFAYPSGPHLLMFDHDPEPQSPVTITTAADLMTRLIALVPALADAGWVSICSTSSAIRDKQTREWLRPPSGLHIYLLGRGDVVRFREWLKVRLWGAGLGYVKLTSQNPHTGVAAILERTIVDLTVFSPERLDYVAPAQIGPHEPFYQDRPPPELHPGTVLDLDTLPDLTAAERTAYTQRLAEAKAHIAPEQRRLVQAKVQQELPALDERTTENEVRVRIARVDTDHERELVPDHPLFFQNAPDCTVGTLTKRHDSKRLADPLEPEYNNGTDAICHWRGGDIRIVSWAHGIQRTYFKALPPAPPIADQEQAQDWDDTIRQAKHHTNGHHRGTTTPYAGTGEDFFAYPVIGGREKVFTPRLLGEALLTLNTYRYTADQLWVYCNGVYRPQGEATARTTAQVLLGNERRETRIEEALRYVEVATRLDEEAPPDCQYINLANGRLDWATGQLAPHTPAAFTTVQLPVEYDPCALCPAFDHYLRTTFDADIHPLIEEILGWCLLPDRRFEQSVMLTGEGGNGKSVLLDLIGYLLGEENISHVALQDLEENRFRAAELYGKLANIFADLDPRGLQSSSMFKTLTTGDYVTAERKHGHPFRFRSYAKLLFSANKIPTSRDKTYAFYRRWLIIPFTKTFNGEGENPKPDRGLRNKMQAELPGILNRALRGGERLAATEAFTQPKHVVEAKQAYIRSNDNVRAFVAECVNADQNGHLVKKEFYARYERWCDRYGDRAVGQRALKDALKQLFPPLDEGRDTPYAPWYWIGMSWSADAQNYTNESL